MTTGEVWKRFLGNGRSPALTQMPAAPAWRVFKSTPPTDEEEDEMRSRWSQVQALAEADERSRDRERGESFKVDDAYKDVLNAVNAALHLRRPLLVTGKPGSGKTSLAYAVAHELKLGVVLQWAVNARSKLQDALYQYDAVARLQDAQLAAQQRYRRIQRRRSQRQMGDYIRLGPVGTAFLPTHLPRVLLIDEIDKCDINLPNDLLNLFEEGRYEIPELVRCQDEQDKVTVRTEDADVSATIFGGRVFCREFPFVIMTSNGERDFPPAFLRRCLRLRMPDPSQNKPALERIVAAHLNRGADAQRWARVQADAADLVQEFIDQGREKTNDLATDQLLNVVYLLTREVTPDTDERQSLKELLLKGLSEED